MAGLAREDERLALARVAEDNRGHSHSALLDELRLANEYLKLEVWAANASCASMKEQLSAMTEQMSEMRATTDEAGRQSRDRLEAVEASLWRLQQQQQQKENNLVFTGHEEKAACAPGDEEATKTDPHPQEQEDLRPASRSSAGYSHTADATPKMTATQRQSKKQKGLRPAGSNSNNSNKSHAESEYSASRARAAEKRMAWWKRQQEKKQPELGSCYYEGGDIKGVFTQGEFYTL